MSRALLLLVGGRAERLGGILKPKLRRPDGRTLLAHLTDELSPLVDQTYLVAPAALHSHFSDYNLLDDPGEGPGMALHAAASVLTETWLLVAGGDQVSPDASLAKQLFDAAIEADGAWCPGQPLFAVYRRARIEPARSLWRIAETLSMATVAADPSAFDDVDTQADIDRLSLRPPS